MEVARFSKKVFSICTEYLISVTAVLLQSLFYSSKIGFRPLTKLKSAVKFFVKNLFKLREIWYNVDIENSVIMGCRNAFGRNKPTNKNGVCMYRGFGTERPYFKKDR